ncbi:hypothetical protein M3Y94_01184000 [Aphelenchoides besseyi]|nr:hypothetical protein M3Y94_01184000 [Aphelenchoides besseyi]KAI6228273.1 hypothetical protein M3Y95_00605300 [Aphelenchoides besseyi]
MGASLCKPRPKKRITTSSWIASESENPFETNFTKKERVCLRETFQRIQDPKEIIGRIFVDLITDTCPELKKMFGVDRVPKTNMLKMPKLGGHTARTSDFYEQMTSMLGFTENIIGAWQLVRKTGRLHCKVSFLVQNQNQLEKNYFSIIADAFITDFIPYVTGEKPDPTCTDQDEKKKVRFAQNYSTQQIHDVWKRFLIVVSNQLTESFEIERQKGLNPDYKQTQAPHQKVEEAEIKRKQQAERQSEEAVIPNNERNEQMFEDPF